MSKSKYKKYIKTKEKNKTKIIFVIVIIILVAIGLTIFFTKKDNNMAKTLKIGKNSTSQEIVDNILNVTSYEAKVNVEIKSNKNSNKYVIKQKYIENQINEQEVLEPSNIQGVKITKEGSNVKIENSRLALVKIIENYNEIAKNNLDLSTFIQNYKNNSNSKFKEKDNQIILETTATFTENNYQKFETLYISKENGKPTKLEIKDVNQNTIIYIIYNEINI